MSLLDQANKAALDQVRADAPQSFTVGAHYDGQTVSGGVSYNRTWKNGWGGVGYAKAWYRAESVEVKPVSDVQAGVEVTKKF